MSTPRISIAWSNTESVFDALGRGTKLVLYIATEWNEEQTGPATAEANSKACLFQAAESKRRKSSRCGN